MALAALAALAAFSRGARPALATLARSGSPPWVGDRQNANRNGSGVNCLDARASPVLGGVDVVAYWSLPAGANATRGDAERFAYEWEGYTWAFSTAANRAAFMRAPRRYAPAWGAFCAYGISSEDWWTPATLGPNTNPDVWRIVGSRLFLFMYCEPERMFMTHANLSAQIALGDARWYEWFGHRGVDVYNVQCLWDAATHGGARDANASIAECV